MVTFARRGLRHTSLSDSVTVGAIVDRPLILVQIVEMEKNFDGVVAFSEDILDSVDGEACLLLFG